MRFVDPQPDDATLEAIYTADYFLGERNPESEERVSHLKRATAAQYLNFLNQRLNVTKGCLLEVGCGTGDLLIEASHRGFEVAGIEISAHAVRVANQRLGAECVTVGTLDAAPYDQSMFDVVIFADVIEHVRDPMDFLRRVCAVLKPGGITLLITPSLDSWSSRLLGGYWMEYKVEHLYYFSNKSITLAMQIAGFSDVLIIPNTKVLSFDYICHHFRRFPVPLITPLLLASRRLTPPFLAHRQLQLVASGIVAAGRKPR